MSAAAPITVDEALARLSSAAPRLDDETVATESAVGRVLAAPVRATHPLPLFDQSAVDGYAVRHADLVDVPLVLPVSSTVAATGHSELPVLPSGTAARIFTGGVLPEGADAVVRQELTCRRGDAVVVEAHVEPGADLRRAGEEVGKGAEVASVGVVVTPGLVGALLLAGAGRVVVRRVPRVHVLVTGDEVVAAGSPLLLGQVPDTNGPMIVAHLRRWGCDVVAVEHLADDESATRAALARAMDGADLVVSSGGVSVGDLDLVPVAAEAIGAERLFWKVAQKPGGPLYAARRAGAVLLGLPGNPAAVVVNLHVYARHLLDLMSGLEPCRRWSTAARPDGLRRDPRKTFWLRAAVHADAHGRLRVRSLPGQASHMLGNLAHADALVRVPASGEPLGEVLRWTPLA